MLVQTYLYLILNFVFSINQATPCQVYPSEYAYHDNSVSRAESDSANCRRYPPGNLPGGLHPEHYIHCDGTQLKLADSNFGQEMHHSSDYYMWTADNDGQLLFILPTRISLTNITLHYYSDSIRGRPRLRFYGVPDDFDIWDALTPGNPYVGNPAVPPGGEPAGHRNIKFNVNFNTKKMLMYKFSSTFSFEVSEVEFFKCMQAATTEATTISATTIPSRSTLTLQTTSDTETILFDYNETFTDSTTEYSSMKIMNTSTPKTDKKMLRGQSITAIIAILVSTVGLLILSSALIIAVVVIIRSYRRRSAKQKLDTDAPYSKLSLNRGSGLQVQPQSTQQYSNELYDQIHLSPSTGQTEFIPKPQSENTNNPYYSTHATHSDTENPVTNESAASQTNSPTATYAAIDKSNKKKAKKDDTKHTAAEKHTFRLGVHAEGKDNSIKRSQKSLDDMHAPDHQDQERVNSDQESIPSNSIEELYTAVQKKPKGYSAPMNESVPQMAEDLYTAVMKKPKENSANDEVAPPIPPHTVEELYTAVHKKPVGNAMVQEDEEEAPPIPPLTVEDTF